MVIELFYLTTFFNFQDIEIEIVIGNRLFLPPEYQDWRVYKTNRKLNKG